MPQQAKGEVVGIGLQVDIATAIGEQHHLLL